MNLRRMIGPLEERQFRLLFFARGFSMLGDGLVPVALAFAVLTIERSASALGRLLAGSGGPGPRGYPREGFPEIELHEIMAGRRDRFDGLG